MSDELTLQEQTTELEPVNITELDTAEKRFKGLSRSFTATIIIIAKMQENKDWETLTKKDGTPYTSLTELVQDALGKSSSYARRLVQTATNLYSPLEAITVEGTVIDINSTEASKLGNTGMAEIVARAEQELNDTQTPKEQQSALNNIKETVLNEKLEAKKQNYTAEFDDDFADMEFDDDFDDLDDLDETPNIPNKTTPKKQNNTGNNTPDDIEFDDTDFAVEEIKEPKPAKKKEPTDFMAPIEKIMSGGKEYTTEEDIATLPEELQEFTRAVLYLSQIKATELSELITKETRGVTYPIKKAQSNLMLVISSTETSSWVLDQII